MSIENLKLGIKLSLDNKEVTGHLEITRKQPGRMG